jgi:hypothetical protein
MRDDNDHPSSVDDLILEPEKPVSIDELVLEKPRMETLLPPLFAVPEAPARSQCADCAQARAPKPSRQTYGFRRLRRSDVNPMRGDGAHDDELVLNTVAAPRAVPRPIRCSGLSLRATTTPHGAVFSRY